MNILRNFKIRTKLLLLTGIAILVAVTLCLVAYVQMSSLAELQDIGHEGGRASVRSQEGVVYSYHLYSIVADAIINRDLEETDKLWQVEKVNAYEHLQLVLADTDTPEEEQWTKESIAVLDEFIKLFEGTLIPTLESTDEVTDEIRDLDFQFDGYVAELA